MRTFLLVIGVALIAGSAAYAHHSYAATYDVTKEVKLEGKLVQFVYRNPHSRSRTCVAVDRAQTSWRRE